MIALAFGPVPHTTALSGILGLAARNALSHDECVALKLGEIEKDARLARAMIETLSSGPAALSKARRRVSAAEKSVTTAQNAATASASATLALKRDRP